MPRNCGSIDPPFSPKAPLSSGCSGLRAITIGAGAISAQGGRRGRPELALLVARLAVAVGVEIVANAHRGQQVGGLALDAALNGVRPLRAHLELEAEILGPLVIDQDRWKDCIFRQGRAPTAHGVAEPQARTDA